MSDKVKTALHVVGVVVGILFLLEELWSVCWLIFYDIFKDTFVTALCIVIVWGLSVFIASVEQKW